MATDPAPAPRATISVPELVGRLVVAEAIAVECAKLHLQALPADQRKAALATMASGAAGAVGKLVHPATKDFAAKFVAALAKQLADETA